MATSTISPQSPSGGLSSRTSDGNLDDGAPLPLLLPHPCALQLVSRAQCRYDLLHNLPTHKRSGETPRSRSGAQGATCRGHGGTSRRGRDVQPGVVVEEGILWGVAAGARI
jgi:hypothetical protein